MKHGTAKPRETTGQGDINRVLDEISGIVASFVVSKDIDRIRRESAVTDSW
jgi:hypothetical protein